MALPEGWFGFVTCDLEVPKDVTIPVLGQHKATRTGRKLIFDNCDKEGYVIFSEQLRFAMARCVKIKRVTAGLRFERSPIFAKYVNLWQSVKEEQAALKKAKSPDYNETLYYVAKLFLNSLYGRCLMKIVDTDTKLVHRDELDEYAGKEGVLELQPIDESYEHWMLTFQKKAKLNPHLPPSCGAAILGYSQCRLYEVFEAVWEAGGLVLYCDTDSAIYILPPGRRLDQSWFSPSEFGLLKIELDEAEWGKLTAFVGVAPKTYGFQFADAGINRACLDGRTVYVHAKGASRSGNDSSLHADSLEGVVRNDEELSLHKTNMQKKRDLSGVYFEQGEYKLKGTSFDKRRRLSPSTFHGAELLYTAPWTEHDWQTDPLLVKMDE